MAKYRVMIVDDDPTSLAIGRALLEGEYDLSLVRSGLQALGFLKGKDLPDLILLDMMMPGIGGMEVLSALKEKEQLRDIPVIFLTGENSVEEEAMCYRQGAADFLKKPVDPEILRIKIQRQLFYRSLKQENDLLRQSMKLFKEQFDLLFPDLPAER